MTNHNEQAPSNPPSALELIKKKLEEIKEKKEEEKRKQEETEKEKEAAVTKLAQEAIAMIDGNTRLHQRNELNPGEKTVRINEEKARVNEKVEDIDKKIESISKEIDDDQQVIDEAEKIVGDNAELKSTIAEAKKVLTDKKTKQKELEETKTKLMSSIESIDQNWKNHDERMKRAVSNKEQFAIVTILAWNPQTEITYQQLAEAITRERNRARLEAQSKYEAEIEGELDHFIAEVDEYLTKTQTELTHEFNELLEEAGSNEPGSVKVLFREAFIEIPNLMARKRFLGISLSTSRVNEEAARRIYLEATTAIFALQDKYNALRNKKAVIIEDIPEVLGMRWSKLNKFPQEILPKPGSILSGNTQNIDRLIPHGVGKEKSEMLVTKLQTVSGRVKTFREEIEDEFNKIVLKIFSPEEGILVDKHGKSTHEALRELMRECERN